MGLLDTAKEFVSEIYSISEIINFHPWSWNTVLILIFIILAVIYKFPWGAVGSFFNFFRTKRLLKLKECLDSHMLFTKEESENIALIYKKMLLKSVTGYSNSSRARLFLMLEDKYCSRKAKKFMPCINVTASDVLNFSKSTYYITNAMFALYSIQMVLLLIYCWVMAFLKGIPFFYDINNIKPHIIITIFCILVIIWLRTALFICRSDKSEIENFINRIVTIPPLTLR